MLEPVEKWTSAAAANDHWLQLPANQPGIRLLHLSGFNSAAGTNYIQVHDFSTEVLTPGNVPAIVIAVTANTNFSLAIGALGIPFGTGIHIALSSTAATYTAVAGSNVLFTAAYALN